MFESMLNTEADRLDVSVGLVFDQAGQVLIGCRTDNSVHHGKWEFPGGKLKQGETHQEALSRELREEIGIEVVESRHCISFPYDYPDKRVMLNFYVIEKYNGEPQPCEQQPLQWVTPEDLRGYELLDANSAIVRHLQSGELP